MKNQKQHTKEKNNNGIDYFYYFHVCIQHWDTLGIELYLQNGIS